ncbi:hypothetical protein [Phenylobacterium immobile]|uniref:hypothetical protein n=1 Tax=Phenylobacterium immobile TaxID=21 RepID=UPI000A937299|nr:hypothetical protein [Phenylobacterium immobile]
MISSGAIALGLVAVACFIVALLCLALPGWKTKPLAAIAMTAAGAIPLHAYYFHSVAPWPISGVVSVTTAAGVTALAFMFLALRVWLPEAMRKEEAEQADRET